MRVRGASAVGVVGLVALSMVVVSGSPASALGLPVPITVPGSVIAGSLDTATAIQRAAAVGSLAADGSLLTMEVPVAVAAGASAGGVAMLAGIALLAGFQGATSVMQAFGVDNAGLGALGLGPAMAPTYIPNSDVPAGLLPGWTTDPVVGLWWQNCGTGSGCAGGNLAAGTTRMSITSAPGFNATAGPVAWSGYPVVRNPSATNNARVSVNSDTSGTLMGTGTAEYVEAWCASRTGVVAGCGQVAPFGNDVVGPGVLAPLGSLPLAWYAAAGYTFDHLSLVVSGGGVVANWYPVGSALRPAATNPTPRRVWETRWTCEGGTAQFLRSAQFLETDSSWPAFPVASCPAGSPVATMSVWKVTPLGGAPDVQLTTWTAAPGLTDWEKQHPNCTTGTCTLGLARIDPSNGTRLSCFTDPGACVNWFTDPNKAADYECTYDGGVVALTECNPYVPTFNGATGTPLKTPAGTTVAAGTVAPYADPATGDTVPATDPAGSPAGQPDGCPPPFEMSLGGLGYWVEKGVTCALAAAFVPQTTPQRVQTLVDTMGTRSPGPELRSIFVWFTPPPGGSSCLTFNIPVWFLPAPVHVIDTCDPNDPIVKAITPWRPLLGVAVWVSILGPLAWWAWKQYAPGSTGVA